MSDALGERHGSALPGSGFGAFERHIRRIGDKRDERDEGDDNCINWSIVKLASCPHWDVVKLYITGAGGRRTGVAEKIFHRGLKLSKEPQKVNEGDGEKEHCLIEFKYKIEDGAVDLASLFKTHVGPDQTTHLESLLHRGAFVVMAECQNSWPIPVLERPTKKPPFSRSTSWSKLEALQRAEIARGSPALAWKAHLYNTFVRAVITASLCNSVLKIGILPTCILSAIAIFYPFVFEAFVRPGG